MIEPRIMVRGTTIGAIAGDMVHTVAAIAPNTRAAFQSPLSGLLEFGFIDSTLYIRPPSGGRFLLGRC